MKTLTRRTVVKGAGALAAGTALASTLGRVPAMAANSPFQPEAEAALRIVRFRSFLQSEGEAFEAIVQSFTDATGVPVTIDSESMQDIGPKATVAATVGAGPDMMWGNGVLGLLFPHRALDVTDVAEYVGSQNGGWYDNAAAFGMGDGDKWIQIPFGYVGGLVNYRVSAVREAGFDGIPEDLEGFAELVRGLKRIGKPAGFAVSRAATGDGNAFLLWALFAHGGMTVDAAGNTAIDSPETVAALNYVKGLHEHFVPGTESWNDGSNNAAFTGEQVYMTHNAISIYGSLLRDGNPIHEDTDHALYPVGPVGYRSESNSAWPIVAFQHTKYPNAVKAFLAHIMSPQVYPTFLNGAQAYFSPSVRGQDSLEVWSHPKRTLFREIGANSLPFSHGGPISAAAALVYADFVVPDMFSQVLTGQKTAEEAAADAAKRIDRFYRI